MKSSKLLSVLQSFSQVEMTRFDKYVHSPYFHVHADTIRLFELLKRYYPDFKEKKVRQEAIYKALFPGQSFKKARLYTLKGYLLKLSYEFLAEEASSKQFSIKNRISTMRGLADRTLDTIIPRILNDSQAELEAYPYRETHYYYESFRLAEFTTDYQLGRQNRSKEAVLQPVVDALDRYYLAQKLKYACAMINHQQIIAVEYQYPFLEEVIAHCANIDWEESPMIGIYYLALMMQKEAEGEAFYRKLIVMLDQYQPLLPAGEVLSLYSLAINFCNRQYKQGRKEFLREMFDIFLQMLRQDLLFTNSATAIIYFKNLVTLGLKLKEYQWTEDFIINQKDNLAETHRESTYNYSLALLRFQQKEYRKCTRHLLQVEFIDDFNRLNYYILLLKTYYESEEIESLLSMCNTAITYIRRNKSLAARNKNAYVNFVKYIRTLARINFNGSKTPPDLKQQIEESALLVERNWLLEKSMILQPQTITHE
ncbi:MAG: hypothetical protein AB8H47_31195 [Bacteroidia bacterium]